MNQNPFIGYDMAVLEGLDGIVDNGTGTEPQKFSAYFLKTIPLKVCSFFGFD